MRRRLKNIANNALPPGFVLLLCVAWECLVRWRAVQEWILPGPVLIVRTLAGNLPLILKHTQTTLLECLAGFALAIVLSFILAFIMDEVTLLRRALYPLLIASQTVPVISVAPLFIIWFGYGIIPKIIVVILVCFFPVALSLLGGLTAVDREYLELFKSMKATRLDIFRMVKLPLALPSFFSGLKIAASYSIMGAVIGEWLGAREGLGQYMTIAQRSFQVDRVFAAILTITLLSLVLFGLVALVERLVIPWNRLTE